MIKKIFRLPKLTYLYIFLVALAIFARFYNFQNSLYFIYDQGRDAIKLKEIVEGNFTLIGPTSGLQGFFLGPLWYYLGIPGFLLTDGSPYGIAVWYIALASLAVFIFLTISKQLFPKKTRWILTTFLLLSFIPGSIWGSIFIWNPLISIPLMAGVLVSLWKARHSRLWLFIGFLLLGFVLHSEFAYAIFILPVLYVLIFWIRKKFAIIDYLVGGAAIGFTLVPQILFELRNNFLMTNSLMAGMGEGSITWLHLFSQRPAQLLNSTVELLVGRGSSAFMIGVVLMVLACMGLLSIWKWKVVKDTKEIEYYWQLLSIIAVVPYIGFMLWRGNNGFFFPYYLTPHFIFIIPLAVLGLQNLYQILNTKLGKYFRNLNAKNTENIQLIFITIVLTFSWIEYNSTVIKPNNQAGLAVIDRGVVSVLRWRMADLMVAKQKGTAELSHSMLVFTPNYLTAQYDYITSWRAKDYDNAIPYSQVRDEDVVVYAIIEPDHEIPEKRFKPWYEKITKNRVLVRRESVGVLTIESWMQPAYALKNGYPEYIPTVKEQMGW